MSFSYSIGRSSLNDICLKDQTVSSIHARIYLGNDGFIWIEDLGSKNGTYVNGFRVNGKSKLTTNDRLSLGAFEFDWMSQIMQRDENKEAAPVQTKSKTSKKTYFMQYAIVFILSATVLGTVLWGANLKDWGTKFPGSTNTENKNGSNDESGNSSEEKEDSSRLPSNIKHDLSCLRNEDPISQGIGIAHEIDGIFTKSVDVKVTRAEEEQVGRDAKAEIFKKSAQLNDSKYTSRVDRIMKKLLSNMDRPRFNYSWYIVDDEQINARTCGGYIFVNKGIIDFAENDDELAAILAHEIYHNELGHIRDMIKKEKIAKGVFGDLSEISIIAGRILTIPFNQENEANCDLYGIDLCEKAAYDGCKAEKLWQRMKDMEGERQSFEKLFSTHPFSKDRANCIHRHLENNYGKSCGH